MLGECSKEASVTGAKHGQRRAARDKAVEESLVPDPEGPKPPE